MKAIYLDTFAGISGNMLLGALIAAGFPVTELQNELSKLNLGEYRIICNKTNKLGIEAMYFNVELPHDSCHKHGHQHRNLHDIMHIIDSSELKSEIKEKAYQVFSVIAEAEAKVHGKTVDEVHFHEVGAIDTIIDIVGCLLGLDYLKIEKIYTGTVTTGFGFIKCAHGIMPVPAPATAELLRDFPQQKGIVDNEMTTPTGAALLSILSEYRSDIPTELNNIAVYYGAGTRDAVIPNVLRMYLGELDSIEKYVIEVACNIDDMTSEVLSYTAKKLMDAGALDVWTENIVMKKGRAAHKLVLLTEAKHFAEMVKIIFTETSTLGIRYESKKRIVLDRKFIDVDTEYGKSKAKLAFYKGKLINIAPEYETCKILAETNNTSLKNIVDSTYISVRGSWNE